MDGRRITDDVSVLLVFVDGLGMGTADPAVNPLADNGTLPLLHRICMEEAVPVDACLGVPGLPQSATGQTALLTGVNAPAVLGRHREGFPDAALRRIISRGNVFRRLNGAGVTATFANAYRTVEYARMKRRSVTTVAARDCPGGYRGLEALERGDAVYQDITNRMLVEDGYDVPVRTPGQAGGFLAELASRYRFTLFEYFQTDRAAHRGTRAAVDAVLGTLERFIAAVLDGIDAERTLFVLTSDHGNIEDLTVRHHTRNPVPLYAAGPGAGTVRTDVERLTDVPKALLRALGVPWREEKVID